MQAIRGALKVSGGSVGRAAKMLGIGRSTLYRRLAEDPSSTEGMPS
jgi:transcriptional regulator of acetoin/glycerol metabolism